jgi:hypothetical protein
MVWDRESSFAYALRLAVVGLLVVVLEVFEKFCMSSVANGAANPYRQVR